MDTNIWEIHQKCIKHGEKEMAETQQIIAFIHAKGNSTRVPLKNLKILGNRPLFCHAIENALRSELITNVVIDSDNDKILEIGEKYGAIPLKRPKELATNLATGDDLAYWQASNYPNSLIVLQVIPTSPFIKSSSIDSAIKLLLDNPSVDSVVGVHEEPFYLWKNGKPIYFNPDGSIPNSNAMEPITYETTGLYINYTKNVLKIHKRMNPENCLPYHLSKIESIDINTPEDFEFAEMLWRGMNEKST